MIQTTNNTTIFVTEYPSFDTAWKAATETSALFAAFQGMENKIKYIKQAQRWFVTENNELYYSYLTDDGVRIVTKAEVHSMLSNNAFQYVQLMVSSDTEWNPNPTGKLRFSGQFTDRKGAINLSKQSEVFAFNK
jgi:hypothetical protein